MIKKILIAALYVIVIASLSAAIIGIFMFLDKPIYQAVILIGVLLSIWVLIFGIRTIVIKYRARQQVKRILQEEATDSLSKSGATDKSLIKKMYSNWRVALKAIRNSQLKLRGEPLYVLPWFLVFGQHSSGKSTSLRNAKLITPKIDLPEHKDGPTLNMDWWLYEEAIVIDTAGRYAIPENETRDRNEWKKLLKKIARHKQKEPLSGLILTVSADKLFSNNDNELLEEGKHIRASLTDLMKNLEAKPPVYLMVTKCDLIPGFVDWCKYLPTPLLRQPMGHLIESEGGSLDEVIDDSLNSVLNRMKELRLLMLERSENAGDSLLTLPVQMENLRNGLHSFANTALKENIYQESPRFRGIYFTAGILDGDTVDHYKHSENVTGAFLHHLYTQILPSDRGMTDNLAAAVRIRNAIKTFSISMSGIVTFGSIFVLSSIFASNERVLEKVKNSYDSINVNEDVSISEVEQLKRLRELINSLDKAQGDWIVPWNGTMSRSLQIQDLVNTYNKQFKLHILSRIDNPLKKKIQTAERDESSVIAGGIVRRINMINQRLSNEALNLDQIPSIPSDYVVKIDHSMTQDAASAFDALYKSYLTWNDSGEELQDERVQLQSALLGLLEKNQGDYEWIIDWANEQGGEPIRLENFWGGNDLFYDNEPYVPAAYTLEGRDLISKFMDELHQASNDNSALTKIMNNFDEYYERRYVKSWVEFAKRFDEGQKLLHGKKDWQNAVERMSNDTNPYFMLLSKLHAELEPITYDDEYQSKDVVDYFYDVNNYSSPGETTSNSKGKSKLALKAISKVGKVGKVVAKTGKKGLKVKKVLGGKSREQLEDAIENASTTYQQYKTSLVAVAFSADSSSNSMNAMVTEFSKPDQLGAGEGALSDAEKSVLNFEMLIGKPNEDTKLFWDLYSGPLRVAREYMRQETACNLQDLWEKNVLAELEGVSLNKISNALIGDGGLVWKYIDNSAQSFLYKRQLRGYQPAQANGMTIPWTAEFLTFINNGSIGKSIVDGSYDVKISSLPTGVNQTAQVSPYSTILELRCADGVQTLSNYNYNSSNEFKWSLEKCGDVSLSISIGQVTLRKEYSGQKGFPEFLKEFRDGHKVFVIDNDFPEYAQQLHNINVYAIDVNYQISGQEPLLDILNAAPMSAPLKVVKCWQQ